MNDGADPHIVEIEADGYDDDNMGGGVNDVSSVVFKREVPDPEDADETITMKVFELPAHRIVYIKNVGEVAETETPATSDAEQADPDKDA